MLIYTCVYDMKSKEKVTCKLFGVISSSVLNGKFSPPIQNQHYTDRCTMFVHEQLLSCVCVCVYVCLSTTFFPFAL